MVKLLRSVLLLVVVVVGAALLYARGYASETAPSESPETAAAPVEVDAPQAAVMPPQLLPTGGPYLDAGRIIDLALSQSDGRGVLDARVQEVLFLTYAEAVQRLGCGWVASMSPDREVYLVSVTGRVSLSRHGRAARSFARTYCVFDASTGRLVVWGATNRPESEDRAPRDRNR
jgi:hypothetical protein